MRGITIFCGGAHPELAEEIENKIKARVKGEDLEKPVAAKE